MSVVTNLVVALMIVTSGEEPVRAVPVKELVCDPPFPNTFNRKTVTDGEPETLYRKTHTTNFVYGTTIDAHRVTEFCQDLSCRESHTFKPCDLFGAKVEQIFFNIGDKYWRCPKHSKTKGGAK